MGVDKAREESGLRPKGARAAVVVIKGGSSPSPVGRGGDWGMQVGMMRREAPPRGEGSSCCHRRRRLLPLGGCGKEEVVMSGQVAGLGAWLAAAAAAVTGEVPFHLPIALIVRAQTGTCEVVDRGGVLGGRSQCCCPFQRGKVRSPPPPVLYL